MESISIEIFRTNIDNKDVALRVSFELSKHFPDAKVNFDLDDCDKILRIKGTGVNIKKVIDSLTDLGYICEVLN
jgi:hypothetical protein